MDKLTTDTAYNLDQTIKKLRADWDLTGWNLISCLREAKENEIWEALDYDSWSSYLAQAEISLRPRTVDRLISAYNRFEELGAPIGALNRTRAKLIAPHLEKDNADELIEKAKTLSWTDLKKEINHEVDDLQPCDHDYEHVLRCKHCKKIVHINQITGEPAITT